MKEQLPNLFRHWICRALLAAEAAGTVIVDASQVIAGNVALSTYAAGAWLAGVFIERSGSGGGFAVTTVAGLVGVVLMASSWRYLRRKRAYEEEVERDAAVEKMSS